MVPTIDLSELNVHIGMTKGPGFLVLRKALYLFPIDVDNLDFSPCIGSGGIIWSRDVMVDVDAACIMLENRPLHTVLVSALFSAPLEPDWGWWRGRVAGQRARTGRGRQGHGAPRGVGRRANKL